MATSQTASNENILVSVLTAVIIIITLFCGYIQSQANTSTSTAAVPEVVLPTLPEEPIVPEIDYQIILGERVGDITATSTLADIIRIYGSENVQDGDIYIGEGNSEKGTIVFPDDPLKRLEIIWQDKALNAKPGIIRINGKKSNWKIDGVTLGTSLKELEALNGKPFKLLGFGWDYGGTIVSWEKGTLSQFVQQKGQVFLRFNYPEDVNLPTAQLNAISGEQELLSSKVALQKLNPSISQILISFADLVSMTEEITNPSITETSTSLEQPLVDTTMQGTGGSESPTPIPSAPSTPQPKLKPLVNTPPTLQVNTEPEKEAVPDYLQKYLD